LAQISLVVFEKNAPLIPKNNVIELKTRSLLRPYSKNKLELNSNKVELE